MASQDGHAEEGQNDPSTGTLESLVSNFHSPYVIGESTLFWRGFLVFIVGVFLYPLITNKFGVLLTTNYFIWIFLAISLTLVWGYTGIFSFGQTAFFGIGAYIYGVVGINLAGVTPGTNIALMAAVILPALFATILGYFMFYGRVSGVYVAIITLSVTLILELVLSSTTSVSIGAATLGGFNGLSEIPDLTVGVGFASYTLGIVPLYYVVAILLLLLYFGIRFVLGSNYGRIMIAVREDEERTEMFGYDVRLIKLQVFTVAGAIAGLGGALFAAWGNFVSPSVMGLATAALPVVWVTVGGRETLIGPIIATYVLLTLNNELSAISPQHAMTAIGAILLIAVVFFSNGIVPNINQRYQRYRATSGPQQEGQND